MIQDRNIHRDARALRKSVTLSVPDIAAGDVDSDVPFAIIQPRYNFRVMDLEFFGDLATAAAALQASVVSDLDVVGSPQFGAAAAVTFTIEELNQLDAGVFVNVAATAAQAFSDAFTVVDGGWGVVLVQIDGAQAITTKVPQLSMGFATEADALNACPVPDSGNGVVGILTIEASGADFDATVDNTSTANAFNTYDRSGHVVSVAIGTDQYGNAALGQNLKDPAGRRILEGAGGSDLLVLSQRSAGAADFTNGQAIVEYRPVPAGGEGRGDLSVSQTQAQFVP